jgi:hypothetical protein
MRVKRLSHRSSSLRQFTAPVHSTWDLYIKTTDRLIGVQCCGLLLVQNLPPQVLSLAIAPRQFRSLYP